MEKTIQLNGKKAQLSDMIFVLVSITSIILTMLFAAYIYNAIKPELNNNAIANNYSIAAVNSMEVAFYIFDKAGMFILIGMIIGLVISSLFIPTSPVFLVINIFGFCFLIFLGAVFSNLHYDIMTTGNMTGIATLYYPVTSYIMNKLPFIGAFIVFLLTIIMYGKAKNEGYNG